MAFRSSPVSLAQATAAARRSGIDVRLFELRYEPGHDAFGYISYPLSGKPVRTPSGRIRLTLQDSALRSELDAVQTIAPELNHLRRLLRFGEVSEERIAEAAAESAGKYFR